MTAEQSLGHAPLSATLRRLSWGTLSLTAGGAALWGARAGKAGAPSMAVD